MRIKYLIILMVALGILSITAFENILMSYAQSHETIESDVNSPVFNEDSNFRDDVAPSVSTPQKARQTYGNPPQWMQWVGYYSGEEYNFYYSGANGYYTGIQKIEGNILYGGFYSFAMRHDGRFLIVTDVKLLDYLNSKNPDAAGAIKNIDVSRIFGESFITTRKKDDMYASSYEPYRINIYPLDIPNGITHNEYYNDIGNFFNPEANQFYEKIQREWGGKILYDNNNLKSRTLGKIEKIDDRCYKFNGVYIGSYLETPDHYVSKPYEKTYCIPEEFPSRDITQDELYMKGYNQGAEPDDITDILILKDGFYLFAKPQEDTL